MDSSRTRGTALGAVLLSVLVLVAAFPGFPSEIQGKKIDINTATSAELQTLPRIGAAVAQRIIDYREEHGKFKKIEEIMKVKGIGEKIFEQIKERITVGEGSRTKKEKGT